MSGEKILIVEDEGIEALDMQQRLISLGYAAPDIASSGEEAVKKAEETIPDLVLMDIMLGGEVDGVMAAEQIRSRFDIPVIYITAYADEDTVRRAKITEPYGYIIKPFQERELHITIDIALYKHKMERKLKESEKWFATTLRSIGDAVIATDKNGLITFMNPVAECLMGWKSEEILHKRLTEVFNIINRDSRRPVDNSVTKVIREGRIAGLANHTLLIAKDGKEIPINDSAAPIRDDAGNIIGVVLVFRDVTEREKAESRLKRLADELKRSNSDLEQFAYIASHDLQSPLRSVESFTQLLAMKYKGKLDAKADEFIKYISDGIRNMQMLINGLLEYSKVGSDGRTFASVDMTSCVNRALTNLRAAVDEKDAEIIHDNTLPEVYGDAIQLTSLFQNLIGNSIKFSQERPKIRIFSKVEDKLAVFSVRDNGIGIEAKDAEKIFAVFRRLHGSSEYPGTGIGLAICKKIVERHGGRIWVESEPDKGSTFYFTLPVQK